MNQCRAQDAMVETGALGFRPIRNATNLLGQLFAALKLNARVQGVLLVASALVVAARLVLLPDAVAMISATWLQSLRPFIASWAIAISFYLLLKTVRTGSLSVSFGFIWSDVLTWRNVIVAVPAALSLGMVMNSFSHFKSNIPELNPYYLDIVLAYVDRSIHFGIDPWQVSGYVFKYGVATFILDKIYYLWFFAIYIPTAIVIGMPDRFGIRHQFLLSYVFVWGILGIVGATAMSSVGPIYYDRVYGGPSPFTDLVLNLEHVDSAWSLTTMQVREVLWGAYVNDAATVISGISAMPSIHNAMCVLLFLAARHVNRWLAVAAAVFGLTIFVGSIHLGWHYAIDAYVSAIGVILLWKLAGYLTGDAAMRCVKRAATVDALA